MERLPKRTRIGPPTLHDLSRSPKGQGWDPPNPSRFGVAPQKDKDGTPQPFTIWSGSPKGQGLDPPNPSRLGGCSFPASRQMICCCQILLINWAVGRCRTPASTASQKAQSRAELTHRKPHALLLVSSQLPPTQVHKSLRTASSGTCQDSPTESLHENQPVQLRKKPNPERDKLTESPQALLFVSSQLPPARPPRKPSASSCTRQDSFTESLHENPPAQPHRKPNPDKDRLTEKPTCSVACLTATPASTASRKPTASSGTRQDYKKPRWEPASTTSQTA